MILFFLSFFLSFFFLLQQLLQLGRDILALPNIRRLRIASKCLSVNPGKLLTDSEWAGAVITLSDEARQMDKSVAFHTHINHPNEITTHTIEAASMLHRAGVIMRTQSVLLRGVNDSVETLQELLAKLGDHNMNSYYLYQHDMVPGMEGLRTPLKVLLHLEKELAGTVQKTKD